jgi:hypothetical protein
MRRNALSLLPLGRHAQPVSVQVGGLVEPVDQANGELIAGPDPQGRARGDAVETQPACVAARQEHTDAGGQLY